MGHVWISDSYIIFWGVLVIRMGVMGPIYSDQVDARAARVLGTSDGSHKFLWACHSPSQLQAALDRHAIFCMWPKSLEFEGVIMACDARSFYGR